MKRVFDRNGIEHRVRPALDGRYDALTWKIDLFGPGSDPMRLYRVTPDDRYRGLIGRRASSLPAAATDLGGALDLQDLFDDVDPGSPVAASHVTGTIYAGETSPHQVLAIAVHGTVRAVTRTYQEGAARRFAAIVPEESFKPGGNAVEVYVVRDGADGAPRLARLSTGGDPYRIEVDDRGTEVIRAAAGGRFPVRDDARAGKVQRGLVRRARVIFRGWVSVDGPAPPDLILIFDRGVFSFSGAIARGRGARKKAGFKLVVPSEAFPDLESAEMRFFAVSEGGHASELRYAIGFPWKSRARDEEGSP